jgi:uncharacterized protein (DUF1697 family)
MRYVALLRGINLGPHRKVGMGDLRTTLEQAGFHEVATILRSGNVVLDGPGDPADTVTAVEGAIADEFGFDVAVTVRTGSEMAAIVEANPYPGQAADDPTKVHVVFLSAHPPDEIDLDPATFRPETWEMGERVLYLHLPDGMGRALLPDALGKSLRGVTATTRNWRTVRRLAELVAAPA